MDDKNRRVIVVGGGLVGPVCAMFMAKRGYAVTLYEYRDDPRSSDFGRGKSINMCVSRRARKSLQRLGLEEEILQHGIRMKGRYVHGLDGKNKSVPYDRRTNECIYSVSRNYFHQKMLDAMDNHSNVLVHFNHKLIDVKVDNGTLFFLQTNENKTIEVQADLIVGADGAFSTLRRAMQQMPLFSFSQTYIDHGYVEMHITAESARSLVPNHLHVWPRGKFMMVALPNMDGTWTGSLFMPFPRFEELNTPDKVLDFFRDVFPDSVDLIGKEQLVKNFLQKKPSSLVSIKCSSFHAGRNIIIVGDAAHAMVPFYGQGMNAGFEDCAILDSLLDDYDDDIAAALETFSEIRRNDAHAICDLAMYNYIEMRDLIVRPSYVLRKILDDFLFRLFPNLWVPLYNSVSFSDMSYTQCVDNRQWQNNVIKYATVVLFSMFLLLAMGIAY